MNPAPFKRKPLIAGNWKMNATLSEAAQIAKSLVKSIHRPVRVAAGSAPLREVEVVLCPSYVALATVADILNGSTLQLGAQNVHWELQGAYTGEVSVQMLKDVGCAFCIIGHSERRQCFGETDAVVERKLRAVLNGGLQAILCVGETLQQREERRTWEVVSGQLEAALRQIEPPLINHVAIAYEPVWAIGTGRNATPAQAQEVHGAIRPWLVSRFGKEVAESIRIQYGGSVKPENAAELLWQPDVDGALVGGASLDPKGFLAIIDAAVQPKGSPCSTG